MSDILFQKEGKIAIITLNRPKRMNAFTIDMIDQWAEALQEYQRDDSVHAVILTGAGERAFCSGIDLNDFDSMDISKSINRKNVLHNHVHRIALALEGLDKPMLCAVNGSAVGAGMDMSLMCDIRFASENARFTEGYIKVGLVPGDGGAYYLPRIVGLSKALELLWTGDFLSAQEAKEAGIVSRVYSADDLMPKTMEFAERLVNSPTIAIRMIKRAVYQSSRMELRPALDLISSHFAIVRDTEDHKEGLTAMLEKRPPKFTGN
ncbi:enoyl-CoA hydratase/isomerase family protein [Neobacillus sp. MM2021_6]|uniref:enoyl-CoA hydratase/isomerase family protein n=1 Tax=Bacillaceae TaxID=186817 RepID=UPI00140A9B99|nr:MULTISPECIES: enoyl-CoA hydratase-related protein [Bacillaceae]MBO0959986.1 enoyl-CoA hydratase/isomerase family protein [Neobacillus sp. MM2021_6]NHC18692.1 enoyl-CoA hydratase [Bacillus sp. MM2020_4]